MGGAVSSGESNDDLIDNLKDADYIKTPMVEDVFRAVDRAFYYTKPHKKSAYKDVAWKDHNLHLSAPCIYSEVMESLQLKDGMSFLNIGSGTGYLSTMAGLILGRNGINHGIEVHPEVVEYARGRLNAFMTSAAAVDLYEFCEPCFVVGNCMDISKNTPNRYDRIYCGAACPETDLQVITDLLKIGGICIVPVNDSLMLIQRTSETEVEKKSLLPVSFATLVTPPECQELQQTNNVTLPVWGPATLSELCRSEVRQLLRKTLVSIPKKNEDGAARKRKKKIHDRRRANRLLVVQRRRNSRTVEGRENGFVAIAYSVGENSSEDDGSQPQPPQQDDANPDAPTPSSSQTMDLSIPVPTNVKIEAESREKADVNHSQDSGTESGQENGTTQSDQKLEEPAAVQERMEIATPSTETESSQSTNSAPTATTPSDSGATIVANMHVANGHPPLTNGPTSAAANPTPRTNSTTSRVRTPTTESILNRIREIIHTRQMEREALRNAGERILEQVDQALREPAEDDEFHDAVNDDDEIDHECVWTSSEDSSSSSSTSSSSEDDSDDYQYAEPIIIGRRHRRAASDDHNPLAVATLPNLNGPQSSEPNEAKKAGDDSGVHDSSDADATVVFHPVSLEMASKINELPLPPPIKRFLNYQRDL